MNFFNPYPILLSIRALYDGNNFNVQIKPPITNDKTVNKESKQREKNNGIPIDKKIAA